MSACLRACLFTVCLSGAMAFYLMSDSKHPHTITHTCKDTRVLAWESSKKFVLVILCPYHSAQPSSVGLLRSQTLYVHTDTYTHSHTHTHTIKPTHTDTVLSGIQTHSAESYGQVKCEWTFGVNL